ncbi:MAG: DUF928 domain-containing protein [Gomphosphaeria aponina SAG 52.96 = DSM 107014]|uniref:DUF928 domain-containing protein n=1 Tax=Gomphosphaeria aponina SAG 52.96 = DSM 107014 TaxID=1521640 RepID=A0A941GPQ6_9CHRO|nr:DUF928 domain-containing protein [Gomphosphaeria aponina SAG 52.96 = DSM 107014]
MNRKPLQQIIFPLVFALILTYFLTHLPTIVAEESNSVKITFVRPTVNPKQGTPTGTEEGAGSHNGSCRLDNQQTDIEPLIALVPEEKVANALDTYVWGKTTLSHPTLWFYTAYPPHTHAELEIQNEEENLIYRTYLPLNNPPGFVSFTLPNTSPELKIGAKYLWYLYIKCNGEDTPDDVISAWIERIALNPGKLRELDLVNFFAENGIWYDTITNLDQLRQNNPAEESYASIWSNLLQQVGLNKISQKPVVQRF